MLSPLFRFRHFSLFRHDYFRFISLCPLFIYFSLFRHYFDITPLFSLFSLMIIEYFLRLSSFLFLSAYATLMLSLRFLRLLSP